LGKDCRVLMVVCVSFPIFQSLIICNAVFGLGTVAVVNVRVWIHFVVPSRMFGVRCWWIEHVDVLKQDRLATLEDYLVRMVADRQDKTRSSVSSLRPHRHVPKSARYRWGGAGRQVVEVMRSWCGRLGRAFQRCGVTSFRLHRRPLTHCEYTVFEKYCIDSIFFEKKH
jgi:hypothetical protein